MNYKALKNQVFSLGRFSLVPIRREDRYNIMKWRNEQIYHLRQKKPLTVADQDQYFDNVVNKLFDQEQPNQILFSYMDEENCIGYGGLVHINWVDKNAELSFIMDTKLENEYFIFHWQNYLTLIENVAFEEIKLHKIFTYAFDLRPKLYQVLEKCGFEQEARLKEQCYINGKYMDVIVHSKFTEPLFLRDASMDDLDITFGWANHPNTRKYAFNQDLIIFNDHVNWFTKKISEEKCLYKLLIKGNKPIGSIRIDIDGQNGLISYLIAPNHTGKGYGKKILQMAIDTIKNERPEIKSIMGLVKKDNIASVRIFEELRFLKSDYSLDVIKFNLNVNDENSW